jgi:hypothetical protein
VFSYRLCGVFRVQEIIARILLFSHYPNNQNVTFVENCFVRIKIRKANFVSIKSCNKKIFNIKNINIKINKYV